METQGKNFIEQIIDRDLEEGRAEEVMTRFPPEPNGYLHIGHAKSILLNYGLAQEYHGKFNLRFDDTNPTKEKSEFVESIKNDVKWLGADYEDRLFFASDYFDEMYEAAVKLIRKGKAFVCDLTADEIIGEFQSLGIGAVIFFGFKSSRLRPLASCACPTIHICPYSLVRELVSTFFRSLNVMEISG